MTDQEGIKNLEEFNLRVFEKLKSQNEIEGVLMLDLAEPTIGITELDVNNVPHLVFVKLSEDTSLPLKDRLEGVLFMLAIKDSKSLNKLNTWLKLIANFIQNEAIMNLPLEELI